MKVILLEVPINSLALRKADSYLNNFSDKNYFYFQIPDNLPKTDQEQLVRIAKNFFKLQINSPIEGFLSTKEIFLSEDIQTKGKEISWEREALLEIFKKLGFSPAVRGEELMVKDFLALARELEKK